MINKDIKPKLSKDIVWKKEGKDTVTGSLASYLGGPIRLLNPVALRIVELIDGKHTIKEIVDDICNCFEGSVPLKVEQDVENFLKMLEQKKVIEPLVK